MLLVFFLGALMALLFAGAESAMLALSETPPHDPREFLPERLEKLLGSPKPLLHSLVAGNLAAVALAGGTLTVMLIRACGRSWGLVLATLALAPLIALATEIFPRVLIRRHPGSFLAAVVLPLAAFSTVTRPLARAVGRAADGMAWWLERAWSLAPAQEETAPAPAPAVPDTTRGTDADIVDSVIEFGEALVKEAMVPRRDMVALPAHATLEEALRLVRETQYSRLPVFRDKPENVVGLLHTKDLLPFAHGAAGASFSLMALARQPFYVPGVMTLDDLLAEFQLKGTHMAFVVDEFGSTAGLITLEDVLEEVFGEIQDEHDREEKPIRRAGRSSWLVNGATPIDEVEDELAVELPETGCETLGGLVFHLLGHLPEPGESCAAGGVSLEAAKVESRRVREVRVTVTGARTRWRPES